MRRIDLGFCFGALSISLACCVELNICTSAAAESPPIKVFILAGQSNMEGKARVSLLERQLNDEATRPLFAHLQDENGQWIVRDDVSIKFLNRRGGLTVGFGSPNCIGPELEFGNVVGDHFEEPVLLIKTAWGGRSLFRDFRSPSAGFPTDEYLADELKRMRERNPNATLDDVKGAYGATYRDMLKEIRETLENLGELFPEYKGRKYELAGFVWFQGWNDLVNQDYADAYAENMAHFIRDVRGDLQSPKLPFVIGVLGVGGTELDEREAKKIKFKRAQASVAELPEFQGNVAAVHTDQFWDAEADAVFKKGWQQHLEEWEKLGSDRPYHYLGSAKTFSAIGRAFGEAALELQPSPR